jgi:alpha/beta superfamily hydrolase
VTDDPLSPPSAARVQLWTADDGAVEADLAPADRPWAGAVVCHPHPAYGGDRYNHVVDRIFHTLAAAGVTVARFDFRLGDGDGDSYESERLDVLAALDLVAGSAGVGPDVPLWLVGYSFGADIALSVGDERVAGWAAVAPPLRFGSRPRPAEGDDRPVLVVAAEHDQFNPPDRLRDATATWPNATVTVAPMADHFLAGAAGTVADEILAWLRSVGSTSAA